MLVINQLLKKTSTTTRRSSVARARSLFLLQLSSSSSSSSSSLSLFLSSKSQTTTTTTTKRTMSTTNDNNKSKYVFEPPSIPSLPIVDSSKRFPIHRIYCVGRNYVDHVKEMGGNPKKSNPTFFTKPSDSIVESGTKIKYPKETTTNLHYEVELVVAIGRTATQGSDDDGNYYQQSRIIPIDDAYKYIYGYGVGIDLTKRDLQSKAKSTGSPWDTSKAFDYSAPISSITPVVTDVTDTDTTTTTTTDTMLSNNANITLEHNGIMKQNAKLNDMIWNVSEIIHELSKYFILQSGDIIFTGTPSGVGPVVAGDHLVGKIDGLKSNIEITIIS